MLAEITRDDEEENVWVGSRGDGVDDDPGVVIGRRATKVYNPAPEQFAVGMRPAYPQECACTAETLCAFHAQFKFAKQSKPPLKKSPQVDPFEAVTVSKEALNRAKAIESTVPAGNVKRHMQNIGGKQMEVIEEYIGSKKEKQLYQDSADDPIM